MKIKNISDHSFWIGGINVNPNRTYQIEGQDSILELYIKKGFLKNENDNIVPEDHAHELKIGKSGENDDGESPTNDKKLTAEKSNKRKTKTNETMAKENDTN